MTTPILLFSSVKHSCQILNSIFEDLSKKNFHFHLFSNRPEAELNRFFNERNWPQRKIFLGPDLGSNKPARLGFALLSPILFLLALVRLLKMKREGQAGTIVCLGLNEKLIVTLPAKILKLKVIWFELPETDYHAGLLRRYRRLSRHAQLVVFSSHSKLKLEQLGFNTETMKLVQPGIRSSYLNFQDNIFHKLAQVEQPQKKFFTIGTVTDLDNRQKIEPIFQAVKKSLSVIPNVQLIVVGEGKEKKNLSWLAKKMEIDSLVWFVGEQAQLKKWFESFDVYLVSSDKPTLSDFNTTLAAMASSLPVIGSDGLGYDDIIFEDKTGSLLKIEDSEILAGRLIKLYQDKALRERLGRAGRERVEKYFTSAKMMEQLEKLL